MKNKLAARVLAQGAMIAAIYTVLTLLAATMNLAYGPVQFRFSEALTILPMFTPAAVPGLTIGCLLSNIFSGYGAADMIFGTLATLLAAISTRMLRTVRIKDIPWLAPLPPVLFNAVIIGAEIAFLPRKASFGLDLQLPPSRLAWENWPSVMCWGFHLRFSWNVRASAAISPKALYASPIVDFSANAFNFMNNIAVRSGMCGLCISG